MPTKGRVLVIDDEPYIRESVEMFLREKGITVSTAATASEGLKLWRAGKPQVIILDIRLPDKSGLEILKEMASEDPDVKIIMITAFHDMDSTIKAMRYGAYDYVHKPLDIDELEHAVSSGLRIARASASRSSPVCAEPDHDPGRLIIGHTPAMRSIFKTIGLLSKNRATVLIEGETGTGKDLIARVIHESSDLADQPYVTVDCTTLVDDLMESELFGHERGAFTGAVETKKGRLELAGSGTIFFDEVGELPLMMQAKLLRFLEYREFTRVGGTTVCRSQARIIAATNRDLVEMARKGVFREDLLFRLNVISIQVPPLQKRSEDIPDMVKFFLGSINQELRTKISRVEEGVMRLLESYPWPGNVREMKNVLTKAALGSRGAVLLLDEVRSALSCSHVEPAAPGAFKTLEDIEREHILESLSRAGGNLSAAARALGLSRPTLRKRLKRYGYYHS